MPNYGRERLNSRLNSEGSCGIMGKNNSSHGLQDTTHLKNVQLIGFIRNYEHETTRLEGLHNNMELMYTTLFIPIFTS
ncbi:hypothetical protein MTR67_011907 [Solanum verrucosum]|uniref:Uncharacterized protein n=1 Tax=Solanum verrucosum TaxID=315347 RepID=A0AAF0Q7R2_SOLVR|nr:hypothetical protein MTR67_011907 [Solanum verrucosum]